jgi:catechol 2,3-dioxygenase-like lactoylglutathione lyase family enzyme
VYVTVQDFARCRPFYGNLLAFLKMECLVDTPQLYYCVGGRTGFGIRAASAEHHEAGFDPYRAGLHHICFRARSREDVDALAAYILEIGAKVVKPPGEDDWAQGYYSVLFEDPGGTRLEANYVPGKGNLDAAVELPLPTGMQRRLSEP